MTFLSSELDSNILHEQQQSEKSSVLQPFTKLLQGSVPLSPPHSSPALHSRKNGNLLEDLMEQSPFDRATCRRLSFDEKVEEQSEVVGGGAGEVEELVELEAPKRPTIMKKRKKRKEEKIVFWQLTTLSSPNFDPSRLTSRQQMALLQKKEELEIASPGAPEVDLKEVAKLCSPFVMDKQDEFYSHWTQDIKLHDPEMGQKASRYSLKASPSMSADFIAKKSQNLQPILNEKSSRQRQWLTKKKHHAHCREKSPLAAEIKCQPPYDQQMEHQNERLIGQTKDDLIVNQKIDSAFSDAMDHYTEIEEISPLKTLTDVAMEQEALPEPSSTLLYPIASTFWTKDCTAAASSIFNMNSSLAILIAYHNLEQKRFISFLSENPHESCCPIIQSKDEFLTYLQQNVSLSCPHWTAYQAQYNKILVRQHLERLSMEFSY